MCDHQLLVFWSFIYCTHLWCHVFWWRVQQTDNGSGTSVSSGRPYGDRGKKRFDELLDNTVRPCFILIGRANHTNFYHLLFLQKPCAISFRSRQSLSALALAHLLPICPQLSRGHKRTITQQLHIGRLVKSPSWPDNLADKCSICNTLAETNGNEKCWWWIKKKKNSPEVEVEIVPCLFSDETPCQCALKKWPEWPFSSLQTVIRKCKFLCKVSMEWKGLT